MAAPAASRPLVLPTRLTAAGTVGRHPHQHRAGVVFLSASLLATAASSPLPAIVLSLSPIQNARLTLPGPAVAEQLARGGARALAVLEGHFTIDQRPAIPVRGLHAPPLAGGEVVRDFSDPLWRDLQLIQVIHDDVRRGTLAQEAPVLESRCVGGEV